MPELLKQLFLSDGFGIEPKVYAKRGGGKIYSGVAVFRSGTFRDSMGELTTWEDLQIKQMVDNWDYLTGKNILQSVPARDGHKSYLVGDIPGRGEVVGWHENVATKLLKSPIDGKQYSYLLVDFELTQQYAIEKFDNGTWRNRSAEVGGYRTNTEMDLWPVYLGFAFVDFPAVEGLNFSSSQTGLKFFAHFSGNDQGVTVSGDNSGTPQLPFPQTVTPVAQPAQPFVFSINGQNVTDYTQVQAYINTVTARNAQLEQFAKDTRETGRKAFVSGLVAANKITAPQQAGMEQFALGLSDEQYGQWKTMMEASPVAQVLGNHSAAAVTNPNNGAQPVSQDIENAEQIVKMHENGGVMSTEQIKNTNAYKLLVANGRRSA